MAVVPANSSQVQFEPTKLSRRRFSRGFCFSNSRCAFRASSSSRTPSSKVGLIGRLMPLGFAQATIPLGAPLGGHAIEKCAIHLAVELAYVHGMHAALEPVVFGPQPTDSCLMLALLLGVAGAKRVAHPSQGFLVKCQAAKQL